MGKCHGYHTPIKTADKVCFPDKNPSVSPFFERERFKNRQNKAISTVKQLRPFILSPIAQFTRFMQYHNRSTGRLSDF